MKRGMRKGAWIFGAVGFFCLVAAIIQFAVLIFDNIEARTQNKGLIALSMLGVIVVLATLCTVIDLSRRKLTVDKPVKKILQATERIAEGDFSTRLQVTHPYGKYDQYDLIMENLNAMAGELGKTEVLKTDFIANVSHELKTPLTVIKSYAALLSKEDLTKEQREQYAEAISLAITRLNDLITNILRLNKLENQELIEKLEVFDLTAALTERILAFEELIEKKNIELSCEIEEDVFLRSSKSYLDVVWNNLLSNALKFTNDGGRVALKLKTDGENAVVSVEDTGVGISPDVGARIFEKFYQADASRAQEGNGLGLALVKKVVDLLGGDISVESELGKGSVFTITLSGVQR